MSEWKEQSRQTHKEFFNRIRELEIARAEQGQQYTTILEKLEDLTGKVSTLSKGLSDIQAEPGRTWKDLKGKISWGRNCGGYYGGYGLSVRQDRSLRGGENMDFGIASVAAITVICYLVGLIVKSSGLDNKYIPAIVGLCGGVLGVAALYTGLQDFPATDPLTAVAVGIVSGLAATGVNQAIKQMKE